MQVESLGPLQLYQRVRAMLDEGIGSWAESSVLLVDVSKSDTALSSCLADVFWLLDIELASDSAPIVSGTATTAAGSDDTTSDATSTAKTQSMSAATVTLPQLLRHLYDQGLLPASLLLERLDAALLEKAGLLSSASVFTKQVARINTGMRYRQQKFNLLAEESEGFSKLLRILYFFNDQSNVASTVDQIGALVGYFDLDPNRITDVFLDVLISSLRLKSCIEPNLFNLMSSLRFPMSTVNNLLGFKWTALESISIQTGRSWPDLVHNFCTVTAHLIRHGLASFDGVYPHIIPPEGLEIVDAQLQTLASTIPTASVANPGTDAELGSMACPDICQEISVIARETVTNCMPYLTAALLNCGSAELARKLLARFPSLVLCPVVSQAVCTLVHEMMETEMSSPDCALSDAVLEWISLLGAGLYVDPSLLCRILSRLTAPTPLDSPWLAFLQTHILPAIAALPGIAPPILALWDSVFSRLPFDVRFGMYSALHANYTEHVLYTPMLRSWMRIESETRRMLRRLTRENASQYSRLLGKLSHAMGGGPLLPLLLEHVMAYDNLILPVVDALQFASPLALDAILFRIVLLLTRAERPRLKEDGISTAQWLSGLAVFTATLFQRFQFRSNDAAQMDLAIILDYCVHSLFSRGCAVEGALDLVLLDELVRRVGLVESVLNISNVHLEALAGGPLLVSRVILHASNSHPSAAKVDVSLLRQRIVGVLCDSGLVVPLWLLLAQQKNGTVFTGYAEEDSGNVKLLAGLVDQANSLFAQYSLLLGETLREDQRRHMVSVLPSPVCLVDEYGLEVAQAMCIWRIVDVAVVERESWAAVQRSVRIGPRVEPTDAICAIQRIFWTHTLSDLSFPSARYLGETIRMRTELLTASRDEKETVQSELALLECELKACDEHVRATRERISRQLSSQQTTPDPQEVVLFYQTCFLPRAIMTAVDAVYAGLFAPLLDSGSFSWSLALLEAAVRTLPGALAALTEGEVHNYSRVLLALIGQCPFSAAEGAPVPAVVASGAAVSGHIAEPTALDEPAGARSGPPHHTHEPCPAIDGHPNSMDGPSTNSVRSPTQDAASGQDAVPDTGAEAGEICEADAHAPACNGSGCDWMDSMHAAFVSAFQSDAYLARKNAIIVLTRLDGRYPAVRAHGVELEALVDSVREDDRADLRLLSARCSAMIVASRSFWGGSDLNPAGAAESGEIVNPASDLNAAVAGPGLGHKRSSASIVADDSQMAGDDGRGPGRKLKKTDRLANLSVESLTGALSIANSEVARGLYYRNASERGTSQASSRATSSRNYASSGPVLSARRSNPDYRDQYDSRRSRQSDYERGRDYDARRGAMESSSRRGDRGEGRPNDRNDRGDVRFGDRTERSEGRGAERNDAERFSLRDDRKKDSYPKSAGSVGTNPNSKSEHASANSTYSSGVSKSSHHGFRKNMADDEMKSADRHESKRHLERRR